MVLSQYVAERPALELMHAGADGVVGYLLKDRVYDLDEFVGAIRRVAAGGSALDPQVVERLLGRRRAGPLDELTAREQDVLALMAEGRSNLGIAHELGVTEAAVEEHVSSILRKLDVPADAADHRRVRAVLSYLRGAFAD